MMNLLRLIAGRHAVVFGALAVTLFGLAAVGRAAEQFPFDQILMLDVAPMLPVKRVPVLTAAPDGAATIGLWCKTVRARIELTDSAIRIEPGPLPDALPLYMVDGQCSDARKQADRDTIAALAQVTEWRRQGQALMLLGPQTFKFLPGDN